MKFCSKCGTQAADEANVCSNCGNPFNMQAAPAVDPLDHTAEFDPKDISDNKVIAMLPYLLSVFGLIIAILLAGTSKYVQFHVRTAIKFYVVSAIVAIISAVLCFTIIVPVAGIVCSIIIFVLEIITFFQVCAGKAKDPAIITSLGFLK